MALFWFASFLAWAFRYRLFLIGFDSIFLQLNKNMTTFYYLSKPRSNYDFLCKTETFFFQFFFQFFLSFQTSCGVINFKSLEINLNLQDEIFLTKQFDLHTKHVNLVPLWFNLSNNVTISLKITCTSKFSGISSMFLKALRFFFGGPKW